MQNVSSFLIASGLTISQWHPSQTDAGEEARAFCLETIKQTYGYDYRPDWHADLDSLTKGEDSWYAPANGGALFFVRNQEGIIIGTGGIYSMTHKKNLEELFGARYEHFDKVGSLVRTYLNPSYRGNALSRTLVPMLEVAAQRLGYTHLNLHCEASATRLRRHWESFGFTNFLNDASTSHYDKRVSNSGLTESRSVA